MKNFLDELLEEVEHKEKTEQLAYYDLALIEIKELTKQIEVIFTQADKEAEIIKSWALSKASKLQDRITFIEQKLESYIRAEELKTLSLPNGTLKLRKNPDKVEITDMDVFLSKANKDMLTIIPEQLKPDLNKIKTYIKMKGEIPVGVNIISGEETFSIKLNKENQNGN
ncbi:MAG: host-nuclease inhibitor Gam family protein [Melioribacteraceae bacterium]|nr:host-nuclease inhibitor Gam family protein [Melioribacteraceae bacterium]